ncbi:unnamed protein product [Meganyctiphanes norvegica]|uniref:Lipocalin/cytosolic fatty-acid binding domain-containing protein n=1 Tax=Meganyctiphanes norvegica TaxID=48144 RepID=A0AAV2Q3L5_MEGNR
MDRHLSVSLSRRIRSFRHSRRAPLNNSRMDWIRVGFALALVGLALALPQEQVDDLGLSRVLSTLGNQAGKPGVPSFVESGKCIDVGVQDNFDYFKYSGKWYMGYKMDNPFLGDLYRCIESDYQYMGPGFKGFKVRTTGRSKSFRKSEINGEIRSTQEFKDASMSVFFPDTFPADYRVIDTDYTSYSCVYSCTTTSNFKSEFGFVFSRKPEDIHKAWMKCGPSYLLNGINYAKLKPTDMSCYSKKPSIYHL